MRTIFFWLLFSCILHNWFAAPFDIYMSVRNNGSGVHEIMQRNEYELSVEVKSRYNEPPYSEFGDIVN